MPSNITAPLSDAESFRTWRVQLGLTQPQAGALLGINRYQVCRIEAGTSHFTQSLQLLTWLLSQDDIRARVMAHIGMRAIPQEERVQK